MQSLLMLEFNEELGYVLGTLYGDGGLNINLENRSWVIRLRATNYNFVEKFSITLAKVLRRNIHYKVSIEKSYKNDGCKRKTLYRTKGSSKEFVKWFLNLDEDKLRELLIMNKQVAVGFIKGFFDSEGSLSLKWGNIFMINKKQWLLKMVKDILRVYFDVESYLYKSIGKISNFNPIPCECWRLKISRPDVLRFVQIFGYEKGMKNA